ncbi:MAG: AraC family transcriptional regulator [Lachnospiraceae bacterium]
MKISKKDFPAFLAAYTEDELFYREVYFQEKEHPETFTEYLGTLDPEYIKRRLLYVPALTERGLWFSLLKEDQQFQNISGNITVCKHYRYTPVFDHEHEFVEILYVYDGVIDTVIQGRQYTLHAGDICIIPPNTVHSVGVFDDSIAFNIIVRSSTFHSTFFQTITTGSPLALFFSHVFYKKTEGNYLIFHTGDDSRIRSVLEDLFIEYLAHEKYSSAFLNTLLMQLWALLLRYHENDLESILTKSYSGASMTEVLNYLTRNYQTVTLHETANHFGYSPSHFSTMIKEGTGRTFRQIIRDIKLGQACRALRETSLSISSICELVGYENPEHFMRMFKKTYGMTPGEYRKTNQ